MAIEVLDFPKTEGYVDISILDGGGMIANSRILHKEWDPIFLIQRAERKFFGMLELVQSHPNLRIL